MLNFRKHILTESETLAKALQQLNDLGENLTLFIVDEANTLKGTLTDGDIRRSLLNGVGLSDTLDKVMNRNFRYLNSKQFTLADVDNFKERNITLLPVLDNAGAILKVINFNEQKSMLPLDAIIMAGGEGLRLRPLTEKTPKPLLHIGDKPILEYIVDRLVQYGINYVSISVNYLAGQIIDHFKDGSEKNITISYLKESEKLGTMGAASLVEEFHNDEVLVINSDLLTNINFENFYRAFKDADADICVASIPYNVNVPYAIFDISEDRIMSLKEKPTFTYYSNAGIYIVKSKYLRNIPKGVFYNATDMIESLISDNKKVIYYPMLEYWLDIGKFDDFTKAQEDIKHIKF